MNRFSGAALVAIVLWGVVALASVTRGQDPVSAVSTGVTLTNDSLKQTLDTMGYEPKALSKGFLLAIKQDTWTINLQVVLSPDQRKVGLNANLGKVENTAEVTADQWLKLLELNGDIDPSAFYFDEKQKKLYLHRSFDNRAITPANLRKEIDNFAGNVRQTEAAWKFTK